MGFDELPQPCEAQGIRGNCVTNREITPCVGIAGDSIEQCNTEKQNGRTHGAENKVFQSCLQRMGATPVVSDQNVKTHSHSLQGNKKHEEMIALYEKHHTCRGQRRHGMKLGFRQTTLSQERHGEERGQQGAGEEKATHGIPTIALFYQPVERGDGEIRIERKIAQDGIEKQSALHQKGKPTAR